MEAVLPADGAPAEAAADKVADRPADGALAEAVADTVADLPADGVPAEPEVHPATGKAAGSEPSTS